MPVVEEWPSTGCQGDLAPPDRTRLTDPLATLATPAVPALATTVRGC